MNDDLAFAPQQKKRAGLFEATLQKLFTRSATVVDIVDLGRAFRLITLGGDALRGVDWTPGDKIQVQLGGWVQRTYTPIGWDNVSGHTRILVFLHADGPGTQWARTVKKGDACVVFGPRTSLALAPTRTPAIVIGDETSLGLAAALSARGPVQVLLEVANRHETTPALNYLGLTDVQLCIRTDAENPALEAHLSALLMQDASPDIILTGRASTIQQLTRFLRQTGIGSGKRHSKPYWAPGKTGLD